MEFLKTKTNWRDYNQVLTKYGRARGMAHVDVINRAASQANFRCAASEKAGGVPRAKLGKHPLNATADPRKGGNSYKNKFYYAEQASLGVKKGAGGTVTMRPAAYKSYAERRRAKGAMAAAFLVSARKLGLKKRGAKSVQPRSGSKSNKSVGIKARRQMKAVSINVIDGSYEVGRPVMDRAIRRTIRDMDQFANKLLQDTNNKFQSGKKIST